MKASVFVCGIVFVSMVGQYAKAEDAKLFSADHTVESVKVIDDVVILNGKVRVNEYPESKQPVTYRFKTPMVADGCLRAFFFNLASNHASIPSKVKVSYERNRKDISAGTGTNSLNDPELVISCETTM